jgi:energy-coupling factor transporter transmembrane protein EcfT
MRLSPALKGAITAAVMIAIALITYYSGMPADSYFQYLVYIVYALGIVWTILAFKNAEKYTGRFWDNFNQGFRCFIIVTLIMVLFTAVFSKMHPEFAEESAKLYKEDLVKLNSKTPAEIESTVEKYKNGYTTMLVYSSIFGYLIIGAIITAATAALTTRRS